jgi:DNA polymerase
MDGATLAERREQAAHCRACPLWANATQTVFGEGPVGAAVMFVGEQPGDSEDRQGRPFVGPAGQMLDRALAEAGIDRQQVYVTNAVKHFKFEPRGKRRIHQKPTYKEVVACRRWLLDEIELVAPHTIVALGATAAHSLLGRTVAIGRERGRLQPYAANRQLLVTIHPSYLLRLPDERSRTTEYHRFVTELQMVAEDATDTNRSVEQAPRVGSQASLF